uniref:Uncharacterized protein n=1 Tax=Cacopsylla melanoneura TaxID=428564 RepID=A0A8D8UN75_9HEMI
MKIAVFLSACLLVIISSLHQTTANEILHRQHRQVHDDPNRYYYRHSNPEPSHYKARPVRETPEYKYEFESYNNVHPANEQERKYLNEEEHKKPHRNDHHKCMEYCKKCGSSFGNSYVCAEDESSHQPPNSFMLFSNKCQMKCYNKCHDTNYRYSTNPLCQKVMSGLESDDVTSSKHPLRHERHHIWINSQKQDENPRPESRYTRY